jgi:siroheme synthase (precorrin-2 oxidase/ferrochelatase)
MPILADWEDEDYYEIQDFYQMVQEFDQDALRKVIEMKPRRENETYQEYGERIERFYDREQRRRERREKRKEFWSDFLFGKKKDDDDQRKERRNGGG